MKKIISIALLMIMFISVSQSIVLGLTEMDYANIKKGKMIHTDIELIDGWGVWHPVERNYTYYTCPLGEFPAYSMDYEKEGVADVGNYSVKVDKTILWTTKGNVNMGILWRTIVNGYPYKTPQELGVETWEEAFLVTQEAVDNILLNRSITTYRSDTQKGKDIIKAIDNLTNIGRKGLQNPERVMLQVDKKGEYIKEGEYYYQAFRVHDDEVEINKYNVQIEGEDIDGIYVADSTGKAKTSFVADEEFRIMIPKEKVNQKREVQVKVNASCKTYPVFYGETTVNGTKDYALSYDDFEYYLKEKKLTVNLNTGEIQIKKLKAESNEPVSGTTYELLDIAGKQVRTATTDENGMICLENLYPGDYKIKEISVAEDVAINPEKFDITVEYDQVTKKTIINDYKTGDLKIIKLEEGTKEPIPDATFEVYSKDWEELIGTYTTDEKGEVLIKGLRTGEYELRPKTIKEGYEIGENVNISIEEGKTIEIISTSKKIPDKKPTIPNGGTGTSGGNTNIPGEKPTIPDENPDISENKPDNPNETPDISENEPDNPNENPDTSENEPDTPNENPGIIDQKPNVPDGSLDSPNKNPNLPPEKPDGTPNKPSTSDGKNDEADKKPGTSEEKTDASDKDTNTSTEKTDKPDNKPSNQEKETNTQKNEVSVVIKTSNKNSSQKGTKKLPRTGF